jgi:hypothetical protein
MAENSNRVLNSPTTWYVVNIKARTSQNTGHYIDALRGLQQQDPLVNLNKSNLVASLGNLTLSEVLDNNGYPRWITISLLKYTMVDPDAFYSRRMHENISMEWDSDIVANKKETCLYFIPAVHRLAFRKNSQFSLKQVIKYLSDALNIVEEDGFDVTSEVDRDILDRILDSYALISLKADISFSNIGHTDGFIRTFDNKMRNANPDRFKVEVSGTKNTPLNKERDGIIEAIINMAESDGNLKAMIQYSSNSNYETIDTDSHPFVLRIARLAGEVCSTIYNELITKYFNRQS